MVGRQTSRSAPLMTEKNSVVLAAICHGQDVYGHKKGDPTGSPSVLTW